MDDNPDESAAAFMEMAEGMMPSVEWAEGQKTMMQNRGWSPSAAETYALELLLQVVRITFRQQTK